jgi:acyl-CoA synthetase (AMP-forming)/AMP-acid ligase II
MKEELRKILPAHTEIIIMYGATEASARLTYLNSKRYEDKIDSIGKAIPGVTITILDKNNKEAEVAEVGELVANGENIMRGYWKDDKISAQVLDEYGYHTGDLGYKDEEGFIYLVGRKDKLLKVGGHRINPHEIEDVIMMTNLVMEIVVVGVPDELLGNKLVALISLINKSTSDDEIIKRCSNLLPKYKMPHEVKIVGSLPKKTNGKIDKEKCLKLIQQKI